MEKGDLSKKFRREAHLQSVLDRLADTDPYSLPYDQRSRLIQYITNQVVERAKQGRLLAKESGPVTGPLMDLRIDETYFSEEVSAIKTLLESMTYSPHTKLWAIKRSKDLGKALREDRSFKRTEARWPRLTLLQRIEALEEFVALQCRVFEEGGISFLPARIKFSTYGALGSVKVLNELEIKKLQNPDIVIRKDVITDSSLNEVLEIARHENLHVMFTQLAIAKHKSMIPENHPMAQDAIISLSRKKYSAYGYGFLLSAYEIDPEERLIRKTAGIFKDTYAKRSAARQAVDLWRQIRHGTFVRRRTTNPS